MMGDAPVLPKAMFFSTLPLPQNIGKFYFVHFKSKWRSMNGYMGAKQRVTEPFRKPLGFESDMKVNTHTL
jgi:hypothetical protein